MLDPILLRIAKTAILQKFDSSYKIDKETLMSRYPFLKRKGAVFVTLDKNKNLRGCIGSIVAYRTLMDDIINNALSAAFADPRFDPLHPEEIDDALTLEVSVLSEPVKIDYSDYADLKSKIVPRKDGLILKHSQYQGTFLPQVWEQLPTTEQFLEHLSYKAGTNMTIYSLHPDIYRYRVEHIKKVWSAILPL